MTPNQINAQAEGWGLFDTSPDGVGDFQIQKDDESSRFESDGNLFDYLVDSAERGGVLEAAALAYHYANIAGIDIAPPGLVEAAREVVESWEEGDLAGAVRRLSNSLDA